MNIVLWILQALLALAFTFSGLGKITQSRDQLITRGMKYVEDYPFPVIRMIGYLEVLGAIGLILPWWAGVAPVLTPIAAVGFMLLMVGAAITHVRRKEYAAVGAVAVLFAIATVIAIGRF
jgi:uncharacterized membrane protein YphA (DoxX/SURF4 family)